MRPKKSASDSWLLVLSSVRKNSAIVKPDSIYTSFFFVLNTLLQKKNNRFLFRTTIAKRKGLRYNSFNCISWKDNWGKTRGLVLILILEGCAMHSVSSSIDESSWVHICLGQWFSMNYRWISSVFPHSQSSLLQISRPQWERRLGDPEARNRTIDPVGTIGHL